MHPFYAQIATLSRRNHTTRHARFTTLLRETPTLCVMFTSSQTAVTRTVKTWMDAECITQARLGGLLGLNKANISRRLRNVARWSLDDLDRLTEAGCPIELRFYGSLDVEVSA